MKPGRAILIVWLAILTIGMVAPFAIHRSLLAELEHLGPAPEFTLTDSNGQEFSSAGLANEVWLASFFFASCPKVCPTVNGRLKRIHEANGHTIRMVSITVDPARDTPAVLAEQARRYGADPRRWHFLTGPKEEIRRLIEQGFGLGADDDPSLHSTRIALIDRSGSIRGLYQGMDEESVDKLTRDINVLLAR